MFPTATFTRPTSEVTASPLKAPTYGKKTTPTDNLERDKIVQESKDITVGFFFLLLNLCSRLLELVFLYV